MKVLVCPLNWGLGHATRCIPLIHELILQGHDISIASDGHPQALLKIHFPDLNHLELKSYDIRYSSGKSQILAMLISLPKIFRGVCRERKWINRTMKLEAFDMIISDNRFGLWHRKAKTIYISHQLMIKMPGLLKITEPMVWLGHRYFINRYDECLIPDFEGNENLSADLSHLYPLPKHARFIGPQSRFSLLKDISPDTHFEVVVLVSGPEPTRSNFEKEMLKRFRAYPGRVLVLRGLPALNNGALDKGCMDKGCMDDGCMDDGCNGEESIEGENGDSGTLSTANGKLRKSELQIMDHMEDERLAACLLGCRKIVCRSGYTTIMDLAILKCMARAEFHATPGQTEQQYLEFIHSREASQ